MPPVSQTSDGYHSSYGGMWIDRLDFEDQLSCRINDGRIPVELEGEIRKFEKKGFVVLKRAATEESLAQFETAISNAFRDGHDHLISQVPGSDSQQPVTAGMNRKGTRIIDSYAVLPSALDLLSSARLVEFLRIVFDDMPLLFQSLSFDMGSGQGLHQDTAYVVVNRPMEMLACWIALEDVLPGSGELQYMVGSHRLGDFPFGGDKKHWDSERDGLQAHENWCQWILAEGEKRGLSTETFLAKRGDILIWHADLAHGGSPIVNAETTRKSLVGHFCPASAEPRYMLLSPDRRAILFHQGISYSSGHYDLELQRLPDNDAPSAPTTLIGDV